MSKRERAARADAGTARPKLPGRMVLVFQGGGALGVDAVHGSSDKRDRPKVGR